MRFCLLRSCLIDKSGLSRGDLLGFSWTGLTVDASACWEPLELGARDMCVTRAGHPWNWMMGECQGHCLSFGKGGYIKFSRDWWGWLD